MRVFVASSYHDLKPYRAAVTRSILSVDSVAEDMLYWPSEETPPLAVSLRRLRASDLVVLILAHAYGKPPDGFDKSITELEFDEAVLLRLPILAFEVNPEYPWPPIHIDSDPQVRARLQTFKDRVRDVATLSSFSTPDSLEASVTAAVANYIRRATATAAPGRGPRALRSVSRPGSLYYAPDSLVQFADAPDGCPLLLNVRRQISLQEEVERVANRLGKSISDSEISDIASRLRQMAVDSSIASDIHKARADGKVIDVLVTRKTIVDLVAPGLAELLLGRRRRVTKVSSEMRESEPIGMGSVSLPDFISGWPATTNSGATAQLPVSFGGSNRFLCIALDKEGGVWSGGWLRSAEGEPTLNLWRPFLGESLSRLENVQYGIRNAANEGNRVVERTNDVQKYYSAWKELLTSATAEKFFDATAEILTPRLSVAKFILGVVGEAGRLHSDGQIHGDIKPGNC